MSGTSAPVWRRKHVLDLTDWTREEYLFLIDQAREMDALLDRPIKKVPALRGKLAVNLFFEPSTRTRVSFELAEKFLSADVVNWAASGSSTSKGETLKDTAWTLEAMGADVVVMRHGSAGAAHYLARKLKRAIVLNGGDGAHAHPTQALLDVYTAAKHFGSLEGRTVAIVGDALHSRVARSDIQAFRTLGCEVRLSGPRTLMPERAEAMGAVFLPDPRKAVAEADLVYLLRIQRERQKQGLFPSVDEYNRAYGATEELVSLARPSALVMHPGPINRGVEIDSPVADGPSSVILEQVRSGVAVRMALLFLCSGGVQA